jgi:hypothetical protein
VVSFAAITLCITSQRVLLLLLLLLLFIYLFIYFVIDSVRKIFDTPSYMENQNCLDFPHELSMEQIRGSSDGIATGCGLDDRGAGVRLPAGAGNFSLLHHIQTGSGAHPDSYPMDNKDSFPGGKVAGK